MRRMFSDSCEDERFVSLRHEESSALDERWFVSFVKGGGELCPPARASGTSDVGDGMVYLTGGERSHRRAGSDEGRATGKASESK